MNEIRLIYYGNVTDISESLLFLLNVVEVRPKSETQNGFYIFETRFGQESIRSLSLDLCAPAAKDVLIYRYLSEREKQALKDLSQPRRFFVLLHNFFNLDYIVDEVQSDESGRFNFLVDMSPAGDTFKPFAYASRHLPSKNFYRVAKVKAPEKTQEKKRSTWHLPMFLLVLLKILINPVNEVKRLAVVAKHSNLRVFSRMLELVLFIDFVIRAVIVRTFRMLGLHLFYQSAFLAGVIKVISIKGGYLFRHVILMSVFKVFGLAVDGFNLLVRIKNRVVETVYYKFLHRLYFQTVHRFYFNVVHRLYFQTVHVVYHAVIKKILDFIIYKVLAFILYKVLYVVYFDFLVKLYFRAVPLFNSARLWVLLIVRYKIPHYVTMSYFKFYGLLYDTVTFSYRFTKLVLLYPFFKVFWFCKFQYEKRLKRFLI